MASKNQTRPSSGPKTRASATLSEDTTIERHLNISKEELGQMLNEILDKKLMPLQNAISQMESSVSDILDEMQRVNTLEENVSEIKDNFHKLKDENEVVKKENQMLKAKVLNLEVLMRKDNVKIFGIPESQGENVEVTVIALCHKVDIELDPQNIIQVHRVGKPRKGYIRPVILKVNHYKDKVAIMAKKDKFKTLSISIVEDYPEEIVKRRKMMLPIFFQALSKYPSAHPKMLRDSMLFKGKEYTIETIDEIAYEDLTPSNVYTKCQKGVTAFFTKSSPLSNHYPCEFRVDGNIFQSAEQYFMFSKAKYFKDHSTAEEILADPNPVKNKRLGQKVSNFKKDIWDKVKADIMYDTMFAKFSQNDDLKTFLLNTGDTKICEASPIDSEWGVGLSLRSPDVFNPENWKGNNLAGQILQRIRQTLK